MAGMEMGRNRVDLSRGEDGRYRGTGVLVRCPSGRRDWEATVTLPGAGKAVFRFAVATDSLPWILFRRRTGGGAGHCVGMCGRWSRGNAITLRNRDATLPHLFFTWAG